MAIDEDSVRDIGEVMAEMYEEPEISFDEDMRSADTVALEALMDDTAIMSRCVQYCGAEVTETMQRRYRGLLSSSCDIGQTIEQVVILYGNHRLRPVVIQQNALDRSLPESACCWSLSSLVNYACHCFNKSLLQKAMQHMAEAGFTSAKELLLCAIGIEPLFVEAWNLLGRIQWEQGDVKESLQTYERCSKMAPLAWAPLQNRLLMLNYIDGISLDDMFQAHVSWGLHAVHEAGAAFQDWLCLPEMEQPLRLGYISPDFCDTSVAAFTKCLLLHHDKHMFDVFVYSSSHRTDDVTSLFKSAVPASNWREVANMRAHDIAEQIRSDRISVLVDLANHSAENRLDVMALKPAPVQFTYAGILNTTGLETIDYSVTDVVADPPDSKQKYTEQLVHLTGCFLCYTPPAIVPDMTWDGGHCDGLMFGSFSALGKITPACVKLWARVLHEVLGSKLLVKNHGLGCADVRAEFVGQFEAHGIAAERLELVGFSPQHETLSLYNSIDIALDTCPFSNVTTTCEALLMGVPTVSLRGQTRASRAGATLLQAVGLAHCVASNEEEYVRKAHQLAEDAQSLATLRRTLRGVLLSSPLCDGRSFMRESFEPMILDKWQCYCERNKQGSP